MSPPKKTAAGLHKLLSAGGVLMRITVTAAAISMTIVYVSEEIGDRRTGGAVGEYTPEEALKQLLRGTGLTYKYLDEKTVTIVPPTSASAAPTPRQARADRGGQK